MWPQPDANSAAARTTASSHPPAAVTGKEGSAGISRRAWLAIAGGTALGHLQADLSRPSALRAAEPKATAGHVVGEPTAERVRERVLQEGGNACDAMVAAALAAAIAAPHQTGIGGHGGACTLYWAATGQVVSLDFSAIAPAAATSALRQPGKPGASQPVGTNSMHGWLTAGVPGILAGLELLATRFGTRPWAALMAPAIELARDGLVVSPYLTGVITRMAPKLAADAGSKKLYFQGDKPWPAGSRLRNPELAEVLATLAQRGSAATFYQGDLAKRIAAGVQANGGLISVEDLAAYRARELEPLSLSLGQHTIYTAPLPSGGLTTLQILHCLQALDAGNASSAAQRRAWQIEAMRLAWHDRLTLLGDPDVVQVPLQRLLSAQYAQESAALVRQAVEAGRPRSYGVEANPQGGTIHLSSADRAGNFCALTLTHGDAFGACVTIEGLGLTLGQGMTRFDPRDDHANGPASRKRPLHNMCPTIVTQGGRATLAIGGRGGRRIPNALLEALVQQVFARRNLAESLAAPRLHTESALDLTAEAHTPPADVAAWKKLGYRVTSGSSAVLSAVALEGDRLQPGLR